MLTRHLEASLSTDRRGAGFPTNAAPKGAWKGLERWSGFPEPFLKGQDAFHRRWSLAYRAQLVRQDIRDLTQVRQITQLETLAALLPDRVGSLLSLNALREELGVAFETVKNWAGIMERFLLVFLVRPWSRGVARALHLLEATTHRPWSAVGVDASRASLRLMGAVEGLPPGSHRQPRRPLVPLGREGGLRGACLGLSVLARDPCRTPGGRGLGPGRRSALRREA